MLRRILDPGHDPPVDADPFGFLRPWGEVPALLGSAPPATPPATGTGVVTFLMGKAFCLSSCRVIGCSACKRVVERASQITAQEWF